MAKLANCKILITGVNGQVGYEIIKALASSGAHLVLASRSPEKQTIFGYETVYLDLARPEEIKRVISEVQPHILINPAAYTAVDKAESAENDAFAINKNAVEAMVESMEILNGAIIHFSTDYVYNPKHSDPALESDSQNPSNVYAASKLAGDMILCDSDIPFIILRTSWVYGLNGNNFVKTMLKLGAERSSLSIVNDQVGSPTSATTLANAVLTILQRGHEDPKSFIQLNRGIYNICDSGETNWYGFAIEIFRVAKDLGYKLQVEDVLGIPTSAYPTPAERPRNSRMNCSKISSKLGIVPPVWQNNLSLFLYEVSLKLK